MKGRVKKVLRILFWAGALLFGSLVLLVLGGALVLSSSWGLEQLRAFAESKAQERIEGRITIGTLSGNLFDHIEVRDLAVFDSDDRSAIQLDRVLVAYSLSDLLFAEKIDIDRLEVDGLEIASAQTEKGLNLTRLLKPAPLEQDVEEPKPEDAPISLEVRKFLLTRGAVRHTGLDGKRLRVEAVGLRAGVGLRGSDLRVAPFDLSFSLEESPLRPLRTDLSGSIQTLEAGAIRVDVAGTLAEATSIHLTATVAKDRNGIEASLETERLDPNRFLDKAPTGELAGNLSLRAAGGPSIDRLEGRLELESRGWLQPKEMTTPLSLAEARLSVRVSNRRVQLEGHLKGKNNESVDATAAVKLIEGGLHVESAELRASLPEVRPFFPPDPAVSGDVVLSLKGSGPSDNLQLQAEVSSEGLTLEDRGRVRGLEVDVDLEGLFARPRGRSEVRLAELEEAGSGRVFRDIHLALSWPGERTGMISFVATGTTPVESVDLVAWIEETPKGLEVRPDRLRVSLLGSPWRLAKGGLLRLDLSPGSRRVSARDISLKSRVGVVRLDRGTVLLDPVEVSELSLSANEIALDQLAPLLGRRDLVGKVDLELQIPSGRNRHAVRFATRGHAVSLDGQPAIDLRLEGGARDGLLSVTASVTRDALAAVRASVLLQAPRRPTRVDAWLRWRPMRALRSIAVDIDAADLEPIGRLLPEPKTWAGRLRGGLEASIEKKTGGLELRGTLKAEGARLSTSFPAVDADLDAKLVNGMLSLTGSLEEAGAGDGPSLGRVSIEGKGRAPPRLEPLTAWTRIGPEAIEQVEVTLVGTELTSLERVAGRSFPVSGALDAEASIEPGLRRASLRARLTEVKLRGMKEMPELSLRTSVDIEEAVVFDAALSGGGADLLTARGRVGLGIRSLLQEGRDPVRLLKSKIQGEARLLGLPLEFLVPSKLTEDGDERDIAGTLFGDAELSGTADSPKARVVAKAKNARLGLAFFPTLAVEGSYGRERVTANAKLLQSSGGRLEADVLILRAESGPKSAGSRVRIESSDFELGFLSKLKPRNLKMGDLQGLLSGKLEVSKADSDGNPRASGWLEVSKGSVALAPPFYAIENGKVRLELSETRAEVTVRGTSGPGTFEGRVTSELDRAKGLVPVSFSGSFKAESFPLAVRTTPAVVDLEAGLRGHRGGDGTAAELSLVSGLIRLPVEKSRSLHPIEDFEDIVFVEGGDLRGSDRKQVAAARPKTSAPIELRVKTDAPIPIRSPDVDGAVSVSLGVSLREGRRIRGEVSVGNGVIVIAKRPWTIRKARILFAGQDPPRPVLDVELVYEFETVRVSILLSGTPDKPELVLTSDPAIYSQGQLLGFVLGGSPDSEPDLDIEKKAAGTVAGLLIGAAQSELQDELPIDTLKVDVGDDIASSRIQLGKWITREIFLGYEHNFGAQPGENTSEGILQYRFLPGWHLEARYGDRGNGGGDLVWQKRF